MTRFLSISAILIAVSVLFASCSTVAEQADSEDLAVIDGTTYSTHYIQQYIDVDALSVATGASPFRIHCTGASYGADRFADRYGDNGYDGLIAINSTRAILNCFTEVDLFCDRDFDERHKAGASLGDIAFIAGVSPYRYVKSGYTQTYDWRNECPDAFAANALPLNYISPNFPVYRRLSEIDGEDLALMERTFYLLFETQPASGGLYGMTLTATDEKGRKIEVRFDWEVSE